MTDDKRNREILDEIQERLADLVVDIRWTFPSESGESGNPQEFMRRLIAQIDVLVTLVRNTCQKTSGPSKGDRDEPRDPRINPRPGDIVSRVVRDIKTTRSVIEVITGPGGFVVEVIFNQAGPTSSRPKRHSLTNFIDWCRKATVEHYGDG